MAREFKFNLGDLTKVTAIETSSYAVIHEIDNVLLYYKDQLLELKQLQKTSAINTRKTINTRSTN